MLTELGFLDMAVFDSDRDLRGVSEKWIARIKKFVEGMPKTEGEWIRSIRVQSWCGGEDTAPTQEEMREHDKCIIKLWREYFNVA